MKTSLRTELEKAGWPQPLTRRWVPRGTERGSSSSKRGQLCVLQFNVLAAGLSNEACQFGGFDAVVAEDKGCFDFENRKKQLLSVFLDQIEPKEDHVYSGADVLCLQECDAFEYFHSELQAIGWDGVFLEKTDAPSLMFSDKADGCAVFWNAKMWELNGEPLRHRFTKASQVALGVPLRRRGSSAASASASASASSDSSSVGGIEEVFITTTHLKATKTDDGAAIRADQAQELVKVLGKCVPTGVPLVLTLDANAVPKEAAFTKFLSAFGSAYGRQTATTQKAEVEAARALEPAYTTWKVRGGRNGEAKHTIDYIFFRNLTCVETMSIPTEEEVPFPRLPSRTLPSDHIMLGATFQHV